MNDRSGEENQPLPEGLARMILDLRISDGTRSRMHDLCVRNQDDALTPAEKEEMRALGEMASLLSILKSRARRTLGH